MKLLVTGCGRGGTNLGIELARSFGVFNVTPKVEDRDFFSHTPLPSKYATKLATENTNFTIENIEKMLRENPDLHILFMIRHPVDTCLSKIYRGRPMSQGGDSTVEETAADGTPTGAAKAIKNMVDIYSYLFKHRRNRLCVVKMENLIAEPEKTIEKVSLFFTAKPLESTYNFFETNRNRYQQQRYGNQLVRNVDLYMDLDNSFDGFFAEKQVQVSKLATLLDHLITTLQYTNKLKASK